MRFRVATVVPRWARAVAPLGLLSLSACLATPVEKPVNRVIQETDVRAAENIKNKVDVLFMVDNSSSMDAMQTQLKARFGDFFKVFDDLAKPDKGIYADLHVGVVTSDFGAGHTTVQRQGYCGASPGGQRGLLQALGATADKGCEGPSAVDGLPYIHYTYTPTGAGNNNLPVGQTLIQTFTCMASVGSGGCGFEHQLESVYAALHNTVENAGFIRDDALLAVVFVTNEDDGSAPPDTSIYEPVVDNILGAYQTYRQTEWAIACNQLLPPYAMSDPLTNCVSAPANLQAAALKGEPSQKGTFDISRYISFFTQPKAHGGIKVNPADDVILVGITGPSTPVQIILADPKSGNGAGDHPEWLPCPGPVGDTCIVALQHACQNSTDKAFFADPGVRVNAVINAVPHHNIASICGDDLTQTPDYTHAMEELGQLISSALQPACLSQPLADPTHPDCVVEDITANADGSNAIAEISWCGTGPVQAPCWRLYTPTDKTGAPSCPVVMLPGSTVPQQYGVEICREATCDPTLASQMVKPNTNAHVACATVAHQGN